MKSFLKKITPDFLLSWYHFTWAFLGAIIFGWPAKKLKVIGVTGTNGKSTVVFLISRILEEAGYQTAALSSIQFKIKDKVWPNTLKMTMPGRMKLQKFLRQAVKAGCQYVVLEVTSEGIKQHRHRFIGFDLAVLTNLTPEHLDSHRGLANYQRAKAKLFQSLRSQGKIIVNLDDARADYFLQFKAEEKYGYTMNSQQPTKNNTKNSLFIVHCSLFASAQNGISFTVQDNQFNLNLLGKFNGYNALAAITIGLAEGISLEKIKSALEKVKGIPGRLEIVIKEPFTAIVDYAHTPDALVNVYQTLTASNFQVPNSKFICVLGAAGGGRDKWKRPSLGKLADQYCDKIIITNEDPYDEDPNQILSEIKSGISKSQIPNPNLYEILDRREAIKKALKLANPGDMVVITGKGSESWMCLAQGKKMPWDDREVIREEFRKLKTSRTHS